MSIHSDVRSAIAATLDTVDDIGKVQTYQRYAKRNTEFKDFYVTGDQLCGWFVERHSFREKPYTDGANELTQNWHIKGFMALVDADASELGFDDKIDAIADAFRADDTLGGKVITCIDGDRAGIQELDAGPVMFAGVLCHGVKLGLTTISLVAAPQAEEQGLIQDVYAGQSPDIGADNEDKYIKVGGEE